MLDVPVYVLIVIISFVLAKAVDFLIDFIKRFIENHRIISSYKQKLDRGEITNKEYYSLIRALYDGDKRDDL